MLTRATWRIFQYGGLSFRIRGLGVTYALVREQQHILVRESTYEAEELSPLPPLKGLEENGVALAVLSDKND